MKLPLAPVAFALCLALPAAAQDGSPKPWFPQPELDLGTHLEGEVATGKWDFRNPHDTAFRFKSFQPSCTCSKAIVYVGDVHYTIENQPRPNSIYRVEETGGIQRKEQVESITIEGGEEGRIEFQLDLRGISGVKEANLVVQTDDEANRVLTLRAKATATKFFMVVPAEINLNKMSWKDSRQFVARISCPIQADFEIIGIDDPVPDQMKVEYRKEMREGAATWVVEGTYGPNVDPRAGGGILNFVTDVQNRRVQLRVMAWVEGPLTVEPGGFVAFGRIKAGEGASKEVTFRPNDDFDLQIEKVVLSNLTIDEKLITVETSKEGTVCKLVITVSADAPRRLVRGDVEVYLNHPAASLQELQFNGFVR